MKALYLLAVRSLPKTKSGRRAGLHAEIPLFKALNSPLNRTISITYLLPFQAAMFVVSSVSDTKLFPISPALFLCH